MSERKKRDLAINHRGEPVFQGSPKIRKVKKIIYDKFIDFNCSVEQVCKFAQVSMTKFYSWMKTDEQFEIFIKNSEIEREERRWDKVMDTLHVEMNGIKEYDPVTGEFVGYVRQPNTDLLHTYIRTKGTMIEESEDDSKILSVEELHREMNGLNDMIQDDEYNIEGDE